MFPANRSNPDDRDEGNLNPDPILICWDCEDVTGEPAERAEEQGRLRSGEDLMRGEINPVAVMAEEAGYPPGVGPEIPGERLHHPSGEPSDDDGAGNISPREEEQAYALEDVDGLEMVSGHRRP